MTTGEPGAVSVCTPGAEQLLILSVTVAVYVPAPNAFESNVNVLYGIEPGGTADGVNV